MKPAYQALALALTLGVAASTEGGNPLARPDRDPFHTGPLYTGPRSLTTPDLGGIGRPVPRTHAAQVTPIPEPSQWALMLAGLALVGFAVRRNRRK